MHSKAKQETSISSIGGVSSTSSLLIEDIPLKIYPGQIYLFTTGYILNFCAKIGLNDGKTDDGWVDGWVDGLVDGIVDGFLMDL